MENIRQYLESTYLKTAAHTGLSEFEICENVKAVVQEAIDEDFRLVMIRPEMVAMACSMVNSQSSDLEVGTVIDFPNGSGGCDAKQAEALQAIKDGADELDFVVDYNAYKRGDFAKVEDEVLQCTRLVLQRGRVIKWIIESAALTPEEIKGICSLIRGVVTANADVTDYRNVYIKSSTGFYETADEAPNGATPQAIKIMLESSAPLPVKVSGGVRNYKEAIDYISLGAKRIGTSSAKAIAEGKPAVGGY